MMQIRATDLPRLLCLIISGCLVFSSAKAQDNLVDLDSFQSGCSALKKGDYAEGAGSLLRTWTTLSEGEAGSTEQNLVASRLLECWVRSGGSSRALQWFRENENQFQPAQASNLWIARALQNEGRYTRAASRYSALIQGSSTPDRNVTLNYSWCLARSGNPTRALEVLETAFPSKDSQENIRRAQLAFDSGKFAKAFSYLDPVFPKIAELAPHWQFLAYSLRAKIWSKTGQNKKAIEETLSWIDTLDEPGQIYRAFSLLRSLAPPADGALVARKLEHWMTSDESNVDLKIASEFAQTLIPSPNVAALKSFIQKHQLHPLGQEARIELSRIDPRSSNELVLDQATRARLNPDLIAKFHYARGIQLFRKRDYSEAMRAFGAPDSAGKGEIHQRALYNQAVSALYSNDEPLFESLRDQLITFDKNAPLIGNLLYLSGLHYAAKGNSKAFTALDSFIGKFPDHPSHIEAELALAELHLNQVPPRPQSAREIFTRLRQLPLTLPQTERLDYTAVWTESIAENPVKLIALADQFLEDWPNSGSRAEVGMLLGTAYYRRGIEHEARKTFLSIAVDTPESELAGASRFFAAKTAAPSEETLGEWNAIIAENSPLSQSARHEKGLLLLSMNRHGEAREMFNSVIEKEDSSSDLRFAVMADLGFAWYMEALAKDRDKVMLGMSANVFGQLSSLTKASRAWRFQGAVRRAKCIEALGKTPVALEIYDSIVAEPDNTSLFFGSESPLQENIWRYRAGFAAIQILESTGDWTGAIKMADALSQKNGPRAIEAARHADLLRLKHWIWE